MLAVASTWISPAGRELFIGDETRYSRVLYELSSSDSIVVLELEGEPYTHKPPLHFWILLLLESFFGLHSVWTFVLSSLVFFLVTCVLTALVSRRTGAGDPLVAAAIFATCWLAWILAQTARMDMLFVVLITTGAILLFESLENMRRGALLLSGLSFGLATLVKGPIAVVIGVVIYGVERLIRSRSGEPYRPGWLEPFVAALVMVVVPLTWLVPALASAGPGYGEALLVEQTLGRAFSSWVHAEPPWFYLVRFPLIFFPWFVLIIFGIREAPGREDQEDRRGHRFLVVWFAAVFVMFSLISGKLDVYMLPATVPAAVLVARYLTVTSSEQRIHKAGLWVLAGMGSISFIMGIIAPQAARADHDLLVVASPLVRGVFWVAAAAATAGVVILWAARSDISRSTAIFGFIALVPLMYVVLLLIPTANDLASPVRLVKALERTGAPPAEIGLYWTPHLWSRAMPRELHRVRYGEPDELRSDPPQIVAVRRDHVEDLGRLLDEYDRIEEVVLAGDEYDIYERRN